MALPLPNLDDRRWLDLVDEARTLIPVYSPEWTDHNLHDPGITLMELLAWIAEMYIYRTNRIPDRHRLAFLALARFMPRPPEGASTVVGFELKAGSPTTPLPASVATAPPPGVASEHIQFLTDEALVVVPGRLEAIQSGSRTELTNLTPHARRGERLAAFGEDPQPGTALYLGFSESLPVGEPLRLQLVIDGGDTAERERLIEQRERDREACEGPDPGIACGDDDETADGGGHPPDAGALVHHDAVLAWEQSVGPNLWRPLGAGEVEDGTRALTLDGSLIVTAPESTVPVALGGVAQPLHYLRARLVGGSYDAPPRLQRVQLNGVPARQETAVSESWTLAAGSVITGPVPSPGDKTGLRFTVDPQGDIDTLEFTAGVPHFCVLGFQAPSSSHAGALELQASLLGVGSGRPLQVFALSQKGVAGSTLELHSFESGLWKTWTEVLSWTGSRRADAHFLLDADRGELTLGDGENGRVLPRDAFLVAVYRATEGPDGNLPADSLAVLAQSAHNRAKVPGFDTILGHIERVAQPLDASGGADTETLSETTARALDDLEQPHRAVTLEDIETLALQTPGSRIARVKAKAAVHPAFPCLKAAGTVTVVVIPFLPATRPNPSAGLRRSVAAFLSPRRVLGTRIEIAAPEYVPVIVRASVRACDMVDGSALATRLRERLDEFFHPLHGGPDHDGWPFGRDVYRSEVLQVLDETDGADHVLSLELIDAEGTAKCGNLCLPPCGLVESGEHEIEVVA